MKQSAATFEELIEKLRKAASTWFAQDLQIDLEALIAIAEAGRAALEAEARSQ